MPEKKRSSFNVAILPQPTVKLQFYLRAQDNTLSPLKILKPIAIKIYVL